MRFVMTEERAQQDVYVVALKGLGAEERVIEAATRTVTDETFIDSARFPALVGFVRGVGQH